MSRDQLAYAAGFVSSGAQVSPWKGGVSIRIMRRDPDPLYRLAELTGIGEVLETQGERFTYYAFNDDAVALVRALRPQLDPSFLARAEELLGRVLGVEL